MIDKNQTKRDAEHTESIDGLPHAARKRFVLMPRDGEWSGEDFVALLAMTDDEYAASQQCVSDTPVNDNHDPNAPA